MSIAEKLLTVAEGVPEVYDSGYSEGRRDGYALGVEDGTEAGKKAEYDTLWDNLQQKGKRVHYSYAFAYTGWNDKNYNPKYPITPTNAGGIGNMFTWNQEITDTKVDITAFGSAQNAFYCCSALKRIPKLIFDGATNVNNMLYYCIKLKELNAEGELDLSLNVKDSPLNKASIISLVNVLSETAEGKTLTLNLAAVDAAFETSEGANDGSTSAEFAALIATKPNWTISMI